MSDDPIAVLTASRSAEPTNGRPHLWPLIIIVLVFMAVAVSIFGSNGGTPPEPTVSATPDRQARIYTISYRFGVFSPTNLRIHAGDTVRFHNESPTAIRIVADIPPGQQVPEFDSVGQVQPNGYFSYTFPITGIFGYHNPADSSEAGAIIVR